MSARETQYKWRVVIRRGMFGVLVCVLLVLCWLAASIFEWRSGQRVWPWSAYALCGTSMPATLPETVRIGLYEEFPVPWRLDKLQQVDFPVTLAIAAHSRAEFEGLRKSVLQDYPQVREVYFWPLLSHEEGYYPGGWSDTDGIRRIAAEAEGMPVLWDLEMPLGQSEPSFGDWWQNRAFLDEWLDQRTEVVHVWRSHIFMGLNPLFLRLAAMHYDPHDYPVVSLQLNLYMTGSGLPSDETARILRCGVERYGERFVPALGVLNDGEGPEHVFVPVKTLRRNLELAREAGVAEVWLFGVNGLSEEYLSVLQETLPLEPLSAERNSYPAAR
ncbi:MAG: hypothetical protein SXV54_11325 [Chloroflexota bacterium]|nr:hypothetical protein [Chloroflexota bacterium]